MKEKNRSLETLFAVSISFNPSAKFPSQKSTSSYFLSVSIVLLVVSSISTASFSISILFFISYFIPLRSQSHHTRNRNGMISLSRSLGRSLRLCSVVSFQAGLACMQHIHEQHNGIIKIHGSIVNKGFRLFSHFYFVAYVCLLHAAAHTSSHVFVCALLV